MKKFVIALLPALVLASPAFGWVGGPFDNGVPGGQSGAATGTYQGVIVGKNISGIMMFGTASLSNAAASTTTQTSNFNIFTGSSTTSTTSTDAGVAGLGSSGSEGRAAIFVDGMLIIAQSSAIINLPNRQISGIINGSRVRSVQTLTKDITTTTFVTKTTTTEDGMTETTRTPTTTIESKSFSFNDVVNIDGTFDAHIDTTFPQLGYSGKGNLKVSEPLGAEVVPISFDDEGSEDVSVVTTVSEIVPIIASRDEPVRVYGVKTSTLSPSFSGVVQIQGPTITESL